MTQFTNSGIRITLQNHKSLHQGKHKSKTKTKTARTRTISRRQCASCFSHRILSHRKPSHYSTLGTWAVKTHSVKMTQCLSKKFIAKMLRKRSRSKLMSKARNFSRNKPLHPTSSKGAHAQETGAHRRIASAFSMAGIVILRNAFARTAKIPKITSKSLGNETTTSNRSVKNKTEKIINVEYKQLLIIMI